MNIATSEGLYLFFWHLLEFLFESQVRDFDIYLELCALAMG